MSYVRRTRHPPLEVTLRLLGLTVLLVVRTVCAQNSNDSAIKNSVQQCPAGSKSDPKSGQCVEICKTRDQNPAEDSSAVSCPLMSQDTYSLALEDAKTGNGPEEPIVKLALPACKDITLEAGEFSILSGGKIKVNLGKVLATLPQYRLAADNTTANVCYPLSPQLLQCTLKRLNKNWYTRAKNGSLINRQTGDIIDIRDYYTSPGSTEYIRCTKSINASRKLRCNYILYNKEEYQFINSNVSIRLLPTNETIYRPEYTNLSNGTINLCYPSTPELTRCTLWAIEKHEFEILSDRRLYEYSRNVHYHMGDYLIQKGKALICAMPSPKEPDFDMYKLLATCQLISAVLLLAAFIIHLLIPSLNYHAKPLLCHMLSMVIMYLCLACRKLLKIDNPASCYALFVFTYLFSAASFFWLNVLAFDLWCIFGNLQTNSGLGLWCSCGSKKHRFYYYSLYAWGCPVCLLIFVVLIDTQRPIQEALQLYPRLTMMCWFNDWKSAVMLIYVPLFIVLACNFLLFVLTVVNLRRASKGVEIVNKKLNKQLLFVCFKIFIVMGISWISEAITYALKTHGAAIYVPDIINATQGVIIFAIYICKPATYQLLRKKFSGKSRSDGKWTTDFNTSKNVERKTSSSGLSMNSVAIRENSFNSDHLHLKKPPLTPVKSKSDMKV